MARDKAELFNKYFQSTFKRDVTSVDGLSHTDTLHINELSNVVFNSNMVECAMLNLDVDKARGPDGIPAVVQECAHELSPSLTQLFNLSMATGQLPSQWKSANVVPVHKKKAKSDVCNYRPVSLLCIISKVMERCIFDHIYPLL